jgi:hypothetical protein
MLLQKKGIWKAGKNSLDLIAVLRHRSYRIVGLMEMPFDL